MSGLARGRIACGRFSTGFDRRILSSPARAAFEEVRPESDDALVISGGRAPEYLRLNESWIRRVLVGLRPPAARAQEGQWLPRQREPFLCGLVLRWLGRIRI